MLGTYMLDEARSVVMLYDTSTQMSDEITHAIKATGALLIYSEQYSPIFIQLVVTFMFTKNT